VLCLPSCCSGVLETGEHGGLSEGVSHLSAATRAWVLTHSPEERDLDCCLVCAHSESEQVWGVPVLPAALYPSPAAFSPNWGYFHLIDSGVEMSVLSQMHLASEVLGYGVVALVRKVLCKDVKPGT